MIKDKAETMTLKLVCAAALMMNKKLLSKLHFTLVYCYVNTLQFKTLNNLKQSEGGCGPQDERGGNYDGGGDDGSCSHCGFAQVASCRGRG